MKTEEKDYLFHEKVDCEHKDENQANNEIERLKFSQIKFKQLTRDNYNKDKKIEKLNSQIEKLRKLNFDRITKPKITVEKKIKEIKSINIDNEVLRGLDRMLCILNEEKKIGLSDLEKTARVRGEICKKIISILIRNNLIKEVKEENNRFNVLYLERI
jgi:hypothetical protein